MIPTNLAEYAMDVICYLIRREMGMVSNYQLIKHISHKITLAKVGWTDMPLYHMHCC